MEAASINMKKVRDEISTLPGSPAISLRDSGNINFSNFHVTSRYLWLSRYCDLWL